MKTTPEFAEAVMNLRSNKNFMIFMNHLGEYGERAVHTMIRTQNTDELRTAQGEARAVTAILDAVKSAPAKFNK